MLVEVQDGGDPISCLPMITDRFARCNVTRFRFMLLTPELKLASRSGRKKDNCFLDVAGPTIDAPPACQLHCSARVKKAGFSGHVENGLKPCRSKRYKFIRTLCPIVLSSVFVRGTCAVPARPNLPNDPMPAIKVPGVSMIEADEPAGRFVLSLFFVDAPGSVSFG